MFASLLVYYTTMLYVSLFAANKNFIITFTIEMDINIHGNFPVEQKIDYSFPGKWSSVITNGDGTAIISRSDGVYAWMSFIDANNQATLTRKWNVKVMYKSIKDNPLVNKYLWDTICMYYPSPQSTDKIKWDNFIKGNKYDGRFTKRYIKMNDGDRHIIISDNSSKDADYIAYSEKDGITRRVRVLVNGKTASIVVKNVRYNTQLSPQLFTFDGKEIDVNEKIVDETNKAILTIRQLKMEDSINPKSSKK